LASLLVSTLSFFVRDVVSRTVPVTDNPMLGVDVFGCKISRFTRKSLAKLAYDRTIGVYPMLHDETCWFLAVDFDKQNWQSDG
jgi:hypothetical protein